MKKTIVFIMLAILIATNLISGAIIQPTLNYTAKKQSFIDKESALIWYNAENIKRTTALKTSNSTVIIDYKIQCQIDKDCLVHFTWTPPGRTNMKLKLRVPDTVTKVEVDKIVYAYIAKKSEIAIPKSQASYEIDLNKK